MFLFAFVSDSLTNYKWAWLNQEWNRYMYYLKLECFIFACAHISRMEVYFLIIFVMCLLLQASYIRIILGIEIVVTF